MCHLAVSKSSRAVSVLSRSHEVQSGLAGVEGSRLWKSSGLDAQFRVPDLPAAGIGFVMGVVVHHTSSVFRDVTRANWMQGSCLGSAHGKSCRTQGPDFSFLIVSGFETR